MYETYPFCPVGSGICMLPGFIFLDLDARCKLPVVSLAPSSFLSAPDVPRRTPYPDTRPLALSRAEKQAVCDRLAERMEAGDPIFNLKSAFPYLINNSFPTPCRQCVVVERSKVSVCGRCIEVPGLCEQCGYFFAAEYALVFQGNLPVIWDMLSTYLKYI